MVAFIKNYGVHHFKRFASSGIIALGDVDVLTHSSGLSKIINLLDQLLTSTADSLPIHCAFPTPVIR
jgi:hypothetical protein